MSKPLTRLALQPAPLTTREEVGQTGLKLPGKPPEAPLATGCNSGIWEGQHMRRLQTDWPKLLLHLTRLGSTLFMTSQGETTHEILLPMYKLALSGSTASIEETNGSLEIDLNYWHCGFALYTGQDPASSCISLHFFDINGKLMHSIYPTLSVRELGSNFLHNLYAEGGPQEAFLPLPERAAGLFRRDVDVVSLIGHWRLLKSYQAIPVILHKHGVSRLEALCLLTPDFTAPLQPQAFTALLQEAVRQDMEICLALHNPGVIQNHIGLIERVSDKVLGCRSNDAYFRLDIGEVDIHNVWVVRKPVAEGEFVSLEVYNRRGELLLVLSGKPRRDAAQDPAWHELLQTLVQRFPVRF